MIHPSEERIIFEERHWETLIQVVETQINLITSLKFQEILLFSVIKYQSVAYEGREYSSWAEGLGWSIACCSMLCIPVTTVRVLLKAEGTFFQVSVKVCNPSRTESCLESAMTTTTITESCLRMIARKLLHNRNKGNGSRFEFV